jgi:nucleoside-diphosphate-sugar epimerase
MRVLITGGSGFIGRKLAAALLRAGEVAWDSGPPRPIERITLFDSVRYDGPPDPRVEVVTGDLTDPAAVERAATEADLVWHLAAVVSAGAEADFDLGYRVNVDGTRLVLEALRRGGRRPRVVFASSFAAYGGEMPEVITDEFRATPQSSYGTQKVIGELLTADYSRKGFLDGRSLRLPTIVVRPGKPNRAASTFASSIVREPLAGQEAICPVGRDTAIYILSPRQVTDALLRAMHLPESTWDGNRTVLLPGITVTVAAMAATLARVAGDDVAGRIRWQPDPAIQRIVKSWPVAAEARRARSLGFTDDGTFEAILRAHIEDELGGVTGGPTPAPGSTTAQDPHR